jgi:hypothetical protein
MDGAAIFFGSLFLLSSPLWVPIVAAAYAIGRKQFSLRFLFGVITAEAIALGIVSLWLWWLYHDFWDGFKK